MPTELPPQEMEKKRASSEIHTRQRESFQDLRKRQTLTQKKIVVQTQELEDKKRTARLQKFFGEDFVDFGELQADPVNKVNSQFAR